MKNTLKILVSSLALVAISPVLVTYAQTQTSTTTQSTAPLEVVKRFVDAVNKNDAKAVRAMFAPNAWSSYGQGGARKTGEALLSWLESDILRVKGQITASKTTVNGNSVTLEGRYTSSGWSGNAKYVFTVQGGLITSWVLL